MISSVPYCERHRVRTAVFGYRIQVEHGLSEMNIEPERTGPVVSVTLFCFDWPLHPERPSEQQFRSRTSAFNESGFATNPLFRRGPLQKSFRKSLTFTGTNTHSGDPVVFFLLRTEQQRSRLFRVESKQAFRRESAKFRNVFCLEEF